VTTSNRFYREIELRGTVEECLDILKKKYVQPNKWGLFPTTLTGYWGLNVWKNHFKLIHVGTKTLGVRGDFRMASSRPTLILNPSPPWWFVFSLPVVFFGIIVVAWLNDPESFEILGFLFALIIGIAFEVGMYWEYGRNVHLIDEVEDLIGKEEEG
jgi:hypothetical protein